MDMQDAFFHFCLDLFAITGFVEDEAAFIAALIALTPDPVLFLFLMLYIYSNLADNIIECLFSEISADRIIQIELRKQVTNIFQFLIIKSGKRQVNMSHSFSRAEILNNINIIRFK